MYISFPQIKVHFLHQTLLQPSRADLENRAAQVEPAALAWLPSTLRTNIGLHSQSQISESDRIQDFCSNSDFQVRLPINQVYATNLQCT